MPDAVTDTHALIWYLEDSPRLGSEANQVFAQCDRNQAIIHVPTICLVEIIYLQERGRISGDFKKQLDVELEAGTSGLVLANLTLAVVNALALIKRDTLPDMPDRIIAATAMALGLPLISRDGKMPATGIPLIW